MTCNVNIYIFQQSYVTPVKRSSQRGCDQQVENHCFRWRDRTLFKPMFFYKSSSWTPSVLHGNNLHNCEPNVPLIWWLWALGTKIITFLGAITMQSLKVSWKKSFSLCVTQPTYSFKRISDCHIRVHPTWSSCALDLWFLEAHRLEFIMYINTYYFEN